MSDERKGMMISLFLITRVLVSDLLLNPDENNLITRNSSNVK